MYLVGGFNQKPFFVIVKSSRTLFEALPGEGGGEEVPRTLNITRDGGLTQIADQDQLQHLDPLTDHCLQSLTTSYK